MSHQTTGPASVLGDAALVQKELAGRGLSEIVRYGTGGVRPALDIAFDWLLIMLAVSCVYRFRFVAAVPALFVIANRQRALGNLLHEAGHRNLYKTQACNDVVARLFLAPALLTDLRRYRRTHARHHAMLGMQEHDPDYIRPASPQSPDWWGTYRRLLFSPKRWLSTVAGHVIDPNIGAMQRCVPLGWWAAVTAMLALSKGAQFAEVFVVSWYIAKATGFHAITTLREMCDHYGMTPGGIYSFTRDVVVSRRWRWIVHPHNNGYHLTHHLMPSVPYYRLPAVWQTLSRLPRYQAFGTACTSYLSGREAVVLCNSKIGKT